MIYIPIVIITSSSIIILRIICMFITAYEWNNGICKKSGKPWICFSVDSNGGIGYTDNAGNYMWK